jgi:YgiT-type zinc finger domain-containing protein
MTSTPLRRQTCPCGGGRFEPRLVTVRMTVHGRLEVFDDVLQGACPNCGSRVYDADTLERIEAAMQARALDPTLTRVSG